jgi:tetratricopeptide (TPR) repeat protein
VVRSEFVNYDDDRYVYANPRTKSGLSLQTLRWALATTEFYNWHPLTWLSLAADAQLYGLNAGGFHLTNLVLHACNVLLVYAVLRELTAAPWRSALVAALFAIHPLHVESVAWISERKGLLSTLFGLASLWAYARFARQGRKSWYVGALLLFAASLLAKQMLVTLPALLLLLDYWPLGRSVQTSWRKLVLEKVPFFGIAALMSAVVYWVQQQGGTVRSFTEVPLAIRLWNAALAYGLYLWKTVWPARLSVNYPHPGGSISVLSAGLAALALAALTCSAFALRKRYPYWLVGWLWFLGALVPVIGVVQIGDQQLADRYYYVPMIGLAVAAAWGIGDLAARHARGPLIAATICGVVICVLAAVSFRQVGVWRNSITLFEHALRVTGPNAMAHYNLANAYANRGQDSAAIEHYYKSLAIRPNDALAHYNLGILAERHDLDDEALRHYTRAIELEPSFAAAHNNLGRILQRRKEHEQARAHYAAAVEADPTLFDPHFNLAVYWKTRAEAAQDASLLEEAAKCARRAVELSPDSLDGNLLLGDILLGQRRLEEALAQFTRVTTLAPGSARAHEGVGVALFTMGRYPEALPPLRQAYEREPTPFRKLALTEGYLAAARNALERGEMSAGRQWLLDLLAVDPSSARGYLALGGYALEVGDPQRAIRHFQMALKLDPTLQEAQRQLDRLHAR